VLNAIDGDVPQQLADCVGQANADDGVHVIVLSGAGRAFCAGYRVSTIADKLGISGPAVNLYLKNARTNSAQNSRTGCRTGYFQGAN
jgi:enoyl-CoA hydratase/carnithine racemase